MCTEIDIDIFIKLYLNYRPVNPLNNYHIEFAFAEMRKKLGAGFTDALGWQVHQWTQNYHNWTRNCHNFNRKTWICFWFTYEICIILIIFLWFTYEICIIPRLGNWETSCVWRRSSISWWSWAVSQNTRYKILFSSFFSPSFFISLFLPHFFSRLFFSNFSFPYFL